MLRFAQALRRWAAAGEPEHDTTPPVRDRVHGAASFAGILSERGEIGCQRPDLLFGQRQPRHVRARFLTRGITQPVRELACRVFAANVGEIMRDRRPGGAESMTAVAALREKDLSSRLTGRCLLGQCRRQHAKACTMRAR